jgi:uncharacterized Zn-binding protein involved in type VI secretion
MAGVARDGDNTNSSVSYNHVYYRVWNPCKYIGTDYDEEGRPYSYCIGGYDYYYANATITGQVNSSRNVYVNGRPITTVGDRTIETAHWSVSGEVVSTKGYSGNGTVTSGNGKNVYANGKLIATAGSSVTTFVGGTTSISQGSNNVFIN